MAVISKQTRKILFIQCGGICPDCGRQMQNKNKNNETTYMTIDHIVPKSMGGTNNIENLRPCCRSCNMLKSNKMTKNILAFTDVNGRYIVVTYNK